MIQTAMDSYDPARDLSDEFADRVASWIGRTGEVLVVLRYLRAAGAKDFALCRSRAEFEKIIELVAPGTDIEVFRNPQLPIRGIVTDDFIAECCAAIRDGDEYLLLTFARRPESAISRSSNMGDTIAELREALEEHRGKQVAVGPLPDFNAPDHEDMTSRSK